jgi:hypothetical protein
MIILMMTDAIISDGMALVDLRNAGMAVMTHAGLATTITSTVHLRLLHLLVKAVCCYSLD